MGGYGDHFGSTAVGSQMALGVHVKGFLASLIGELDDLQQASVALQTGDDDLILQGQIALVDDLEGGQGVGAARLPQGRFSIFGESGTVFRCPCQSVDRLASLILNLDIQITGLNFVDTRACGVGEPCESSAYQHGQAQNHGHDAAQQGPFGTLAVCHSICLLFFACDRWSARTGNNPLSFRLKR